MDQLPVAGDVWRQPALDVDDSSSEVSRSARMRDLLGEAAGVGRAGATGWAVADGFGSGTGCRGRQFGHLAAGDAAAPRLPVARDPARRVGEHAAVEQALDEVDLVADR